jgi:hypothetical protein
MSHALLHRGQRIRLSLSSKTPRAAQAVSQERTPSRLPQQRSFLDMARDIVEQAPVRSLDERRAALFAKNVENVFNGTEWLTGESIGQLRNPQAANPHAAAARWREQRRIFGVQKQGRRLYPRYAFSETWEPLPVVARVLAVLGDLSDKRIASWFESPHGHLGGLRPRELLGSRPNDVEAAARAHAAAPVHG